MPRTLPPNEAAICARLRQWREAHRRGRADTAKAIGIPRETLANYETAVTPLKWRVFAALHRDFDLDPFWLATGIDVGSPLIKGFDAIDAQQDERASFSQVYKAHLAAQFEARRRERERPESLPYRLHLAFIAAVAFRAGSAEPTPEESRTERKLFRAFEALIREVQSRTTPLNETSALLDSEKEASSAPVIAKPGSLIESLRQRLARATQARGAKLALANAMGVTAAAVSEWLSGASAPTADNALRLDQWLSTIEAAKQKTAPVLGTPTRRKAQARKTNESKTNSGPPRSSRKRA